MIPEPCTNEQSARQKIGSFLKTKRVHISGPEIEVVEGESFKTCHFTKALIIYATGWNDVAVFSFSPHNKRIDLKHESTRRAALAHGIIGNCCKRESRMIEVCQPIRTELKDVDAAFCCQ